MKPPGIFIEPGGYKLGNMGDAAMLQVAYGRLRARWPDAAIRVITKNPARLQQICPGAIPIPATHRATWLRLRYWSEGIGANRRWDIQTECRRLLLRYTKRLEYREFAECIRQTDLLVVAGMGGINDFFAKHAFSILRVTNAFVERGIPSVMFSQGIGPLEDPALRALAAAVLKRVSRICLRESTFAVPLLLEMGVAEDRLTITGDDALALEPARKNLNVDGIGISLRSAGYAGTAGDEQILPALRHALIEIGQKTGAELVPIPISVPPNDCDITPISMVTGLPQAAVPVPRTPLDCVEAVARCRVVITGTYHAAVFALSLGIPVICLVKTSYYRNKFEGLRNEFGCGCEIVPYGEALGQRLLAAFWPMWRGYDAWALRLKEKARKQVEAGVAAYERAYELVNGGHSNHGR